MYEINIRNLLILKHWFIFSFRSKFDVKKVGVKENLGLSMITLKLRDKVSCQIMMNVIFSNSYILMAEYHLKIAFVFLHNCVSSG